MLEKILVIVSSLKVAMEMMLKCRRKRSVTELRPPPGGPMAAISWRSIRWMALVSFLSYLHRDEGEGREGEGRRGKGRSGGVKIQL